MHRKRLALRVIGSVLIAAAARGQATHSLSRKYERNEIFRNASAEEGFRPVWSGHDGGLNAA